MNSMRQGLSRRWALPLAGLLLGCASDQEIESPVPLYGEVPIEYPLDMWDQGIEAETLLRVRVNDQGIVDSVMVVESSGYPSLDSAALAGARDLRFQPARKGGKRVEVWAKVPVHFTKRPPGSQLDF